MTGPHLLVSVRDAAEAVVALAGGADVIDVKEPSRGPLGRADAATIAAVGGAVAGRAPVSVALGELQDYSPVELPSQVAFAKWGLSGMLRTHWPDPLRSAATTLPHAVPVAVAYADWSRAEAPPPADIVAYAIDSQMAVVLFDTFQKVGSTLLDWLSVEEITALVATCREAGVKVALAGSLTAVEIERLRDVRPDWFAVRGAVCDGGRGGAVSERRVRDLADLVHSM